jgi:hypothetical protein
MCNAATVAPLTTTCGTRLQHLNITTRALAGLQFATLRYVVVQASCAWRADVARLLAAAAGDVQTLQ